MDQITRLAQSTDKEPILSFCKNTFSWGDYIHEVWDSWIQEGNLIVIEHENLPISMAHAALFPDEKMIWIEGIRVNENFRKNGIAQKMITNFENYALTKGFTLSRMLVASENIPSLSLAHKLGYEKISKWNYFSLESKEIYEQNPVKYDSCLSNFEIFDGKNLDFIDSWRWIPLTNDRLMKLDTEKKIVCKKNGNETTALGIITESKSFENTIILEILFGTDLEDMIKFVQNLAHEKNYSKVRILTELDSLPQIQNLENKFPFYLMEKNL